MIPFAVASSFFAVSILLAFSPGPDNIFVLTQSLLNGRFAGLAVTVGLASGILIHTAAVSLGVAALLATSPVLFNALKLVGATYLLYLAWGAFNASAIKETMASAPKLSTAKLFFRGFIMNVTNPKVTIFFLAFLPQFTNPNRGSVALQIVQLGGLFIVSTLLIFGGIALLAGLLGPKLQNSQKFQRILNRTAAVIFGGLALKLLSAQL
ncbi:MAG: threonine/homoserine/homoserine lactone efflux protein [Gammaproteobacteria bacterium]|jgi:threonine/homoserine/homoserine lactone efflux protein